LYNGLSVESVLEVNAASEMERLGLKDHLSVQRSNGLRAMVERIRSNAKSQIT
jgi:cysteine desulfuration protein SufE